MVTDDPDASTEHLERLEAHSGIECLLVTPTDFRRIWSALDLTARGRKFVAEHSAPEPEPREPRTLGEVPGSRQISPYLVSVYEAILLDAVSEKASDIHIEQYGERVRIRLRVDGELHDLTRYHLTPRELRGVINVIKLRAELNIAEHRLPQGGAFRTEAGRCHL